MGFYLIWQRGDIVVRGQQSGVWVDGSLIFPIAIPGTKSDAIALTLRSSARDSHTFECLKNIKLYLTGDPADLAVVQSQWPYLGKAYTPERPELNGGFDLSFDNGRSWVRFCNEIGLEGNRATYLSIPATAVGESNIAGQLGPLEQAYLLVRYTIPAAADRFKIFDIRLDADFDIV